MEPLNLFKVADCNKSVVYCESMPVVEVRFSKLVSITRLSFKFKHPQVINPKSTLSFKFKVLIPGTVAISILEGDLGFPEINFKNVVNEHYRFKRGNFKDFVDVSSLHDWQAVELPIESFIFNIDMKSNADKSKCFWGECITDIYFDFLGVIGADAAILFSAPHIHEKKQICDCVIDDLIDIDFAYNNNSSSCFVSERNPLYLSFLAKHLSWAKFGDTLHCSVRVVSTEFTQNFKLSPTKKYIRLDVPRKGQDYLLVEVFSSDSLLASGKIPITRSASCHEICETLGISDSEMIFDSLNLSGRFRRICMSLESAFLYPHNRLRAEKRSKWIVSLKHMPKCLAHDPSKGDFYRYGPKSRSEFKNYVVKVVDNLLNAGVSYIEPWNEANVIYEWNDSFEALRVMQEVFYEVTRGTGIKLLTPSSTTWDFQYFKNLIKYAFHEVCDGIALHGYTYSPLLYGEYIDKISALSQSINKKIFITEIGFRRPFFSPYEQSLYLTLFSIEAIFSSSVDCCIWFKYMNSSPENLSAYDQNRSSAFAMVGYKGKYATGLLAAYQFSNHLLHSLSEKSLVRDGDKTVYRAMAVYEGRKRPIAISFDGTCKHKSIELRFPCVVLDLYGNEVSCTNLAEHKIVYVLY